MNQPARIPVEIEPEACVSYWWLPLAIAVSVLMLANLALIKLDVRHTTRHEEWVLQSKWALGSDPSHSFDWIIVGDSSGLLGVDPTLMSTHLSGSCVNLCTFGSMGVAGDLWSVEQYLKHHSPPRGVIMVHAANVWSGKPSDAFFQYSAALPESTPKLLARLLWYGARPSELFTTLRYRNYVPITMVKDLFRKKSGWSDEVKTFASTPSDLPPNGAVRLQALQANPSHVIDEASSYLGQIQDATEIDWHHRLALNRLIDLARENDFGLFLANGPIATTVHNSPRFNASMTSIDNELKTLAAREPQFTCLLSSWFAFPPELMENSNHVVGPAVDTYTEKLAHEILNCSLFNRRDH